MEGGQAFLRTPAHATPVGLDSPPALLGRAPTRGGSARVSARVPLPSVFYQYEKKNIYINKFEEEKRSFSINSEDI